MKSREKSPRRKNSIALTNSSISLSPRSNRSSLKSWESDSGKVLSKFSLNSSDCNASKLDTKQYNRDNL